MGKQHNNSEINSNFKANRSEVINGNPAVIKPVQSLSKDTIEALEELGIVLKGIHQRMVSEGYEIKNGIINKVKNSNEQN